MNDPERDAASLFAFAVEAYAADPDVTPGTGFGSNAGLRVRDRIFAMVVRGELVVKLPAERVAELVAAGRAHAFEPSAGRRMREWAVVSRDAAAEWPDLVAEARRFVGGSGGRSR